MMLTHTNGRKGWNRSVVERNTRMKIGIICFGIFLVTNEWINHVNAEYFEQPSDKYKEHFQKRSHENKYKEHFLKLSQNITTLDDLEAFFTRAHQEHCKMILDWISYYSYAFNVYLSEDEPHMVKELLERFDVQFERTCYNFELPPELNSHIRISKQYNEENRILGEKASGNRHDTTGVGFCRMYEDFVKWYDGFQEVSGRVLEDIKNTKLYTKLKADLQLISESYQPMKQNLRDICENEDIKLEICEKKNSEYMEQCIRELIKRISLWPVQEYLDENDDDVTTCLAAAMAYQSKVKCLTKTCGDYAGKSAKEESEAKLDKICSPDLREVVAEWVPITVE